LLFKNVPPPVTTNTWTVGENADESLVKHMNAQQRVAYRRELSKQDGETDRYTVKRHGKKPQKMSDRRNTAHVDDVDDPLSYSRVLDCTPVIKYVNEGPEWHKHMPANLKGARTGNKSYVEEFPNHYYDKLKQIREGKARQVQEVQSNRDSESLRGNFGGIQVKFVSIAQRSRSPARSSRTPSKSMSIAASSLQSKKSSVLTQASRYLRHCQQNSVATAIKAELSTDKSTEQTQVLLSKTKQPSTPICHLQSPFDTTKLSTNKQLAANESLQQPMYQYSGQYSTHDRTRPTTEHFASRNNTVGSLSTVHHKRFKRMKNAAEHWDLKSPRQPIQITDHLHQHPTLSNLLQMAGTSSQELSAYAAAANSTADSVATKHRLHKQHVISKQASLFYQKRPSLSNIAI
jgi:hypothetical protein